MKVWLHTAASFCLSHHTYGPGDTHTEAMLSFCSNYKPPVVIGTGEATFALPPQGKEGDTHRRATLYPLNLYSIASTKPQSTAS